MDIEKLSKRKRRVQRDGNLGQLAEIVKELGDIYFEAGKYEDALQEYKEQLEVCNTLGDKLNIAIAHRMVGEIYANLGTYEEALKHQNLYLEGAKEIKNLLEEQRAYATLGRTYFCWAESLLEGSENKSNALSCAKKAYMKSIRLCNELGDTGIELKELMTMRARLLLNLGLVLETQKDHKEAVDLMGKAAALCQTHNLRDDFHRTQIALGGIYERQHSYELALKHFENAAEIDNTSLKAEARVFQAELLLKMERWQESRKILVSLYATANLPQNLKHQVEKYLRIVATLHTTEHALSEEKSTSGKLKLYEILGDAAVAANCFEKAVDYYKKMLECAVEIKSDRTGAALLSLAQTLKDVGRCDEALEFAQKELILCTDPRETCRSALFLADLLIAIKAADEKIQEIYNLALKNAKDCANVSLEASVLKERLNFLKASGKTDEIETLQERLKELDKLSDDTDSENESEENNIGANICLEDLSDVEAELKAKGNNKISRKRTRNKSMIIKRNEKGETQLHVACINGNIENVEKLLEAGHSTNVRDHFGWTPLHEAANHGYVEIAALLLKHGADVNDPGSLLCQGVTPLHDAASCGNITMMRLLIQHGANIELRTNEDDSVLDCLEQWRNRVDYLSPNDQAQYDEMYNILSAIIPSSKRKNSKRLYKSPHSSKTYVVDEDNTAKNLSAGEDYKRTIASLKRRNDPIGIPLSRNNSNVNPLLNSEEVLLDDWLEDDINENIGNRRYSDETTCSITKRKSNNGNIDFEKNLKRQKTSNERFVLKEKEFDLVEKNSNNSNDSYDTVVTNCSIASKPRKGKQQTSLLSIGFSRNPISRSPSPENSSPTEFELRETDSISTIILNVSVEGKVFKTQVEFSNTTKPLMQNILADIETQFYNDSGCKAKFDLKTVSGIVINCNNLLTILNEGDIIKNLKCEIIELETPSIVDRYGIICKTYDIDVRDPVLKCLKSCENTRILRLKQEDISKKEFMSVLKTVKYEKDVQILDLSGGELYEIGKVLNDCVLKLLSLQELCLQGCDIDSDCLNKLDKLPVQLKLLDLSYNPLGPASQEILYKLLSPLTQLQTLKIRYCQLCNFQFISNNCSLVNIDISWNSFNKNGLCNSLQRQLLNLNLSNTVFSSEFNLVRNIFTTTNLSFSNLECLEVAACDLFDIDVRNILSQVSNLSKLILRGNRNIGVQSLNLLLKHTPTLRYIDASGCTTITEYPDVEIFIENPVICTLIVSMYPEVCDHWVRLWRGNGTVKKLPHNLVIFKPSKEIEN